MTFFPPVTQDALVRAVLRFQLGDPFEDGPDLEEALALAAQAHVEAINDMDADQERPEGWKKPQEAAEVSRTNHPLGYQLTDGGTGHLLSYVHWALWKGGVEEPVLGDLMRQLWSGLRPETVARVNMDLKAHRDHRMPDEQRSMEESLLAENRALVRKIQELTDTILDGQR